MLAKKESALPIGERPRPHWVRRTDSTRTFYEQRASEYAAALPASRMESVLSDFVRLLPRGARVIDLGCGAGYDLSLFLERDIEAFGLDYSRQLGSLARGHSGAPVVIGDMRQLPFAPSTFDGAWASASLLHLERHEVRGVLDEIYRLLRPRGLVFTSIKSGQGEQRDEHGRWFCYYDPAEWTARLGEAGFEILETQFENERRQSRLADEHISWIRCIARRQ